MNIWEVSLECEDWANPYQTVMIATKSMDIEVVIPATRDNFKTGRIVGVKYVGFAHLPKAIDPTESARAVKG